MKTFRNSTLIFRTSLIALTLGAAASAALAGSITYTAVVPTQVTDLTNAPAAPAIPYYNLGNPLTSVTITITANGETTFNNITNNSTSSGSVFIGTQTTYITLDDLTSPGIDSILGVLSPQLEGSSPGTTSHGVISGGTTLTKSPLAGYSVGPLGPYAMTQSGVGTYTDTTPADLALFVGAGDMDFVLNTNSQFILTTNGSNNLSSTISTDVGATITVVYNYSGTPIYTPEPGTLGLFGTGLLGLAGLVRFKFLKSK